MTAGPEECVLREDRKRERWRDVAFYHDTSMSELKLHKQVAPPSIESDSIEVALMEIWKRNFRPRGMDRDDHILNNAIGVRRLMRFASETEAILGCKIPTTAVLRLGTVKAVAAAIRTGIWPEPSPLLLIRDGRTDSAVYIVSTGDGVIVSLCDVASLIDFPGQIWGLQLPGLDGETEPLTSIPDMAQHYVDAILTHGTASTHHVIGYSFGGLVAVEMVRLLQARGQELGLVGLLDTACDEKHWPRSLWFSFALKKAARRILEVRNMSPRAAVGHLAGKVVAALRLARRRVKPTAGASSASQSIYYVGGLDPDFQRVRDASIRAFESHNPRPINCKIVLFKSRLGEARACNPIGIWKRLASDLEVVVVPGSHTTMIRKPLAESLAAEISQRLAGVSNAAGRPRLVPAAWNVGLSAWVGRQGWVLPGTAKGQRPPLVP
jgi:thioesterase domain-containing protein